MKAAILPIAFVAIVAATIFGAIMRAGAGTRFVCTIAGSEVTTDARHATETPAGWVVETPRGVVVAQGCWRAP